MDELTELVLKCANKVSGKSLPMTDCEDLTLQQFQFDSLSTFAFMIELENEFGVTLDETLFGGDEMKSIRSTAALIAKANSGTH